MAKTTGRKTQDDVLLRSAEFIGWALGGIEREIVETRQRLESLTRQAAQLRSRVGSGKTGSRGGAAPAMQADVATAEPQAAEAAAPRARRQMSAAARKRISDRQKKRWADWRKKKGAS